MPKSAKAVVVFLLMWSSFGILLIPIKLMTPSLTDCLPDWLNTALLWHADVPAAEMSLQAAAPTAQPVVKLHSSDKLRCSGADAIPRNLTSPQPFHAEAAGTQEAPPAKPQELPQAVAGPAVLSGSRKRKQSMPHKKPSNKKSKHKKAAAAGQAQQGVSHTTGMCALYIVQQKLQS